MPNKAACHDNFSVGDEEAGNPLMEVIQLEEMKDSPLFLSP